MNVENLQLLDEASEAQKKIILLETQEKQLRAQVGNFACRGWQKTWDKEPVRREAFLQMFVCIR